MKLLYLAFVFLLAFFPSPAEGVIDLEIRGPVAYATSGLTYLWNSQNCPLFFYEMDDNLGNEAISLTVSDDNIIKPNYIKYSTLSYINQFEHKNWGFFEAIGFQGKQYIASYLYDEDNPTHKLCNSLKEVVDIFQDNLISRILINDDYDKYKRITISEPLQLKEGYLLSIVGGSSENNQLRIELRENGNLVNASLITDDMTYKYKKKLGDYENVILIAVHFKTVFIGDNQCFADIDGVWQISSYPIKLKNVDFNNMAISNIDSEKKSITISNEENIALAPGKHAKLLWSIRELSLNDEIGIRVAKHKNVYYESPFRFYIYKKIREPGSYQIRGPILEILTGVINIDANSFAGFYYDLDEGINTEELKLNISNEKELEIKNGIIYTTSSKKESYSYDEWGYFNALGFMGRKFFASYDIDNNIAFGKSNDGNLLGDKQQLSEVLMDYDDTYFGKLVLREEDELNLSEGYHLRVKSIDIDGNKVYLELYKGNDFKESKVILPSKGDPVNATFFYNANLGEAGNITLIKVHFNEAMQGSEEAVTSIDGIWQISETTIYVGDNQEFGNMEVESVDKNKGKITLVNKNRIQLKNDKEIMHGIWIRTSSDQKRFCIYRDVIIGQHKTFIIQRELKN